jgi:membrane fusion protein, hemolysin D
MSAKVQTLPVTNVPPQPPSVLNRLTGGLKRLTFDRDEREFLPAHIEILQTPTSPMAVTILWAICLMFTAALAWSILAKLDIHAVASGRVQPNGRSKLVQPFDPGVVKAVHVQNGQAVKAGDVLIELDPTEARALADAATRDLEAIDAEIVRRQSAIIAVRSGQETIAIPFSRQTSPPVRKREEAALAADLGQYFSSLASLRAQLAEKHAQKVRFTGSTEARGKLMAILKQRVDMRETLVAREAGTKAAVLDALQLYQDQATSLAYEQGQLLEAEAGIVSLDRRIEQTLSEFVAQQTQKLTEAEQKSDRLRQDVIRAEVKEGRTRLTAPIDGTVQQLAVTTVGQVVTSGQPLLIVVPSEGRIEVEALVLNRDIGFVEIGQEAVVKLEAFPFTKYGTIAGKVVRISRDAVDDRDAMAANDPTTAGRSVAPASGTPKTQNLVFPVTIELSRLSITTDNREVPLTPGMMATVEILTGDRRVIDYLLSPLREVASTAGRER